MQFLLLMVMRQNAFKTYPIPPYCQLSSGMAYMARVQAAPKGKGSIFKESL